MSNYHQQIMPAETMRLLSPSRGGIYVDGTLGGGGHSRIIFEQMPHGSQLIGIDRDIEAITEASSTITSDLSSDKRFTALHGNFFDMSELLNAQGISAVDGILLDLGVSSHQLDDPSRGFSYKHDAPIDMRMDMSAPLSAYDVVNGYDERRLYEIIRDYGEERFASRIARGIVQSRELKPIATTYELTDVIKSCMPQSALREKQHPAKRTFQAIRIEVNSELRGLSDAIKNAIDLLNPGGVIAIITFHSLEDRITKQAFQSLERPCTCDPKAPVCTCGKEPSIKILTKKPVTASEQELVDNPRARSAKLRAAEHI